MMLRRPGDLALVDALEGNPTVLALMRVGSSTRSYIANIQDLDYLAVTERPVEGREVLDFLGSMKPQQERSETTTEPVSWRIQLEGRQGGVVFVEHEVLSREVHLITSGAKVAPSYSQWALGGNAPEVLCADLLDGVVLLDRGDCVSRIRASLLPYPEEMRSAIVRFSFAEIGFKRRALEGAISNSASITSRIALVTALLPVLRARCAMAGVYFRGLKNADSFLRHHLTEREEEICTMLTMGSWDGAGSGLDALRAIEGDLAYWLKMHSGLDAGVSQS